MALSLDSGTLDTRQLLIVQDCISIDGGFAQTSFSLDRCNPLYRVCILTSREGELLHYGR